MSDWTPTIIPIKIEKSVFLYELLSSVDINLVRALIQLFDYKPVEALKKADLFTLTIGEAENEVVDLRMISNMTDQRALLAKKAD